MNYKKLFIVIFSLSCIFIYSFALSSERESEVTKGSNGIGIINANDVEEGSTFSSRRQKRKEGSISKEKAGGYDIKNANEYKMPKEGEGEAKY